MDISKLSRGRIHSFVQHRSTVYSTLTLFNSDIVISVFVSIFIRHHWLIVLNVKGQTNTMRPSNSCHFCRMYYGLAVEVKSGYHVSVYIIFEREREDVVMHCRDGAANRVWERWVI